MSLPQHPATDPRESWDDDAYQAEHDEPDWIDDDAVLEANDAYDADEQVDEAEESEHEWQLGADLDDAPAGQPWDQDDAQERVRFAVPVKSRIERTDHTVEGFALNLSTSGLACVLPADLERGERVWIAVALGLDEAPATLLCQVVWRREGARGDCTYGLEFVALTPEERDTIGALVAERSEGRAGAWPLPLAPREERAHPTRGRPSAARGLGRAAAGLLLGLGVAFALSVGALRWMESTAADNDNEALALLDTAAPGGFALGHEDTRGESQPLAATDLPPPPSQEDLRAMSKAAQDVTQAAATPAPEASDVPRPELELLTDSPIASVANEGVHAFWLDNPRRLVVDVDGRKSAFASSDIDVDHPLATRIRVGTHPHKVRFVIETKPHAGKQFELRGSSKGVLVSLSRG